MLLVCGLLFLTGAYPLYRAWRGNRRTTLIQALNWTFAAWTAWGGMLAFAGPATDPFVLQMCRFLALAMTGGAGIAVLGARRPGVDAWNFVVLGLLAVMLLPLFESLILGPKPLDGLRAVFVAGTLAVSVLNYLPTRFGLAALLLGLSCAWETWFLLPGGGREHGWSLAWIGVALSPWLALLCWKLAPPPRSEFDGLWLDFRNRFGLLLAQRVREQFNRAAANAGWMAHLHWQGLSRLVSVAPTLDEEIDAAMLETLRALLRRFDRSNI